jgi:hypothetical protein
MREEGNSFTMLTAFFVAAALALIAASTLGGSGA